MMGLKRKSLAVLLVLSIFLLSSCEVYKTLYGPKGTGQVTAPVEETPTNETPAETPAETPETTETPEAEVPETPEEQPVETEVEIVDVPEQKPIVIVAQETDLLTLIPKAEDPDTGATLAFTFTSPFNDEGNWQTTYGDAGEYTVTITVSDGQLATTRDVLVILNKKEESPTIDTTRPIDAALIIDETDAIDFSAEASDLNKDPLTYSWKLDGDEVSSGNEYTYHSTYDDAGSHTIKIEVSDGTSSVSKIWAVNVENVNRKPVLQAIEDVTLKETEKLDITALATDDDNDAITYSISDKKFAQEDNVFTWETNYDSAGTYEVTLSASDGKDTTEQTFKVTVENVNRPPMIVDVAKK